MTKVFVDVLFCLVGIAAILLAVFKIGMPHLENDEQRLAAALYVLGTILFSMGLAHLLKW